MKKNNMNLREQDKKAFIIGMIASMSAVIAWDIVKKSLKIFNYENKTKNENK